MMSSAKNKWCIMAKFYKNWKPLEQDEFKALETSEINIVNNLGLSMHPCFKPIGHSKKAENSSQFFIQAKTFSYILLIIS